MSQVLIKSTVMGVDSCSAIFRIKQVNNPNLKQEIPLLQEGREMGYSPIKAISVCAAPNGMVFEPLFPENGYRFQPFRCEA